MGAFAFGVASAFAGFCKHAGAAHSGQGLLLGIGGCNDRPSTLSLIVNLFKTRRSATGDRIWGTAFALGGLVGPLIGGICYSISTGGSYF